MNATNMKNKKYMVETPMEELSEETIVEEAIAEEAIAEEAIAEEENAETNEVAETVETANTEKVDLSYEVEVSIPNLNIRKGPGKDYDPTGSFTGIGIFPITDVKTGVGSDSGWGKLESGAGWISLDYAKRV